MENLKRLVKEHPDLISLEVVEAGEGEIGRALKELLEVEGDLEELILETEGETLAFVRAPGKPAFVFARLKRGATLGFYRRLLKEIASEL